MKTPLKLLVSGLTLLALATLNPQLSTAFAQGTAFTYQGQLNDGGSPANGTYDLQFALFDAAASGSQVGGTVTNLAVGVTNGLFTTTIDFGPVFAGNALWLQIGVETNGGGGNFTLLSALQPLTPAPYAIYASSAYSADGASWAGTANYATYAYNVEANAVTAAGIASGQVVKSLNSLQDAVTLSPGANISITPNGNTLTIAASSSILSGSSNAWSLTGNAGTSPAAGNYVGTTDNQPLELHVYGQRALRLEPNTSGAPNVIGGAVVNYAGSGVVGATVGGGGAVNYSGSAYTNCVTASFGTVGGGAQNAAITSYATVGGGYSSTAGGACATVGGGQQNTAGGAGATVGGGLLNIANNSFATVGGGYDNQATNTYATVPGGNNNVAGGTYSFAAGDNAVAANNGAFVWADSSGGTFSSTANNQFSIRAAGGVRLVTSGAGVSVDGAPVLTTGSSSVGLTIQQNAGSGAPNIILGSPVNYVAGGLVGATISGGGATNYGGSAYTNCVTASFGTVGGGFNNTVGSLGATVGGGYDNSIQPSAQYSVLGGGYQNSIQQNAPSSVLGGGYANSIQSYAYDSVLGGGGQNSIGPNASFSFLGGGSQNSIQSYASTSFLGGGEGNVIGANASYATVGGGKNNSASAQFATVAGGYGNTASGDGAFIGGGGYDGINYGTNQASGGASVIGGGLNNTASGFEATVGGGWFNTAGNWFAAVGGGGTNTASGEYATVGGGWDNTAGGYQATVGGGSGNTAGNWYATVGGGSDNTAGGQSATIPGGSGNVAAGQGSFVAGLNATDVFNGTNCNHSFVWGDGSRQSVSQGANTFNVLATGGVWIFSGAYPAGVKLTAGSSSWATISDRNAKKNFQPVDTVAVLEKLAAIPIQQWNYKWEKDGDVPNIGPMAQDFKAAFYPGRDDKSITTLEFDGVELAAIQGLNQKVEEQSAQMKAKDAEIQDLKTRLEKLEQALETRNGGGQ